MVCCIASHEEGWLEHSQYRENLLINLILCKAQTEFAIYSLNFLS